MTTHSWIRNLFTRPATRPIRKAPHRFRLALEMLEDRVVPSATIYTVTSTGDSPTDPSTPTSGDLRYCIGLANANTANPAGSVIEFDQTVFNSPQTIILSGAQLELSNKITLEAITGPGANLLSVSGNNASRVFQIDLGVAASLSGLTVTGGRSTLAAGIYVPGGKLTADSIVVSNNVSTDGTNGGGGIGTDTAVVTISNSAIVNNTSASVGGGIFEYFNSNVTLVNCTLAGNTAGQAGGAIQVDAPNIDQLHRQRQLRFAGGRD